MLIEVFMLIEFQIDSIVVFDIFYILLMVFVVSYIEVDMVII